MPTEQRDPPAHNRAVVLDSFAWIEYFNGTSAGERGQVLMENGLAVTPAIVVAVLSEKYRRLNRQFGSKYDFVRARTSIIPLEADLARAAAQTNFETKEREQGWR